MKPNAQNIFGPFWLKTGLWLTSVSFILFYLILAYNNRIASDDLYFVTNLSRDGLFESVMNFKYNQRVTSHLLYNLIFVCNTDLRSLHLQVFFFHIATITGFLFSVKFLIHKCFDDLLNFPISRENAFLLSSLYTGALFFFTFQLNEVWFWTISSVIHLVPLIFIFYAAGVIIQKKSKSSSFIFIFLAFFFVGGCSETVALTVIVLLSFCIFVVGISKNSYKKINQIIPQLITALVATSILFLVNILGSSTNYRVAFEGVQNSSLYIFSFQEFFGAFMQFKNVVFLLFLPLFFLLGNRFFKKGLELKTRSNWKTATMVILVIFLVMIATFSPLYFVFDSLGPQRAWTPFGTGIATFLIGFSFYLGNRTKIVRSKALSFVASGLVTMAILFYITRQTPVVFKYSRAYDQRTEWLLELNRSGQKDAIGISPLPSSGMLINSKLEKTPDGWHNEMLRVALGLNFNIYAASEKESVLISD